MLSSLWWKVNPARYFTFRWRKVRARSKVSLRTVYACSVTSPLVTIIGNTPKIMWMHPKIYIGRFDWNTPVPGPASLTLPKSFVTWNHEGGLLRIVSMLALVLQIVMFGGSLVFLFHIILWTWVLWSCTELGGDLSVSCIFRRLHVHEQVFPPFSFQQRMGHMRAIGVK